MIFTQEIFIWASVLLNGIQAIFGIATRRKARTQEITQGASKTPQKAGLSAMQSKIDRWDQRRKVFEEFRDLPPIKSKESMPPSDVEPPRMNGSMNSVASTSGPKYAPPKNLAPILPWEK